MRKERRKKDQTQNPGRKKRIRILSWTAAIVSLAVTTGALILPAMTMTGEDEIISDFAGEDADWIESSIVQDENTSALEGGPLFYDPEAEEETESELDPAGVITVIPEQEGGSLPDGLLLSEDETETETETETLTESVVWTETGAEAVTEENTVKPETEPEAETETDAAGTETETEAETETETETDAAGTETETEAETETETGTDAAETERETDTDVDIVEPETESDSTEAETESDSTEAETESDFIEPGMTTLPAAYLRKGPAAARNALGSILNSFSVDSDAANAWQVVDQGFSGNAKENKTSVGSDSYGAVRVQKNVIPTGTENEFYVYLSIDTKLLMSEYLRYAQYQATTSNNYHGEDLGTVVNAMTGNERAGVSGDASSGYPNSAKFTIEDSSGNVIAENATLYWSQAENDTFYLKTSTGKYILMGVEVRKNSANTVRLSAEAEQYIYGDVMKLISLDSVTDTMGDYIEYLGPSAGDYSSADPPSYSEESRTLTWHPVMKSNPQEQTAQSGNTITSWSLNVAELVYKVRLNVQNDGFNSCASNMQSGVNDKESYAVNRSASLSYQTNVGTQTESGTAAFQ